jgi:hypothetical protein
LPIKKPEFEDDVLPSARIEIVSRGSLTEIVRCHQHDRESHALSFFAEFRDECTAFVWPLVKNNRFKPEFLDKTCYLGSGCRVMSMNDEDLMRSSSGKV